MNELNLPAYEVKVRGTREKPEIFDFLRKRYVSLTPEEWVRQNDRRPHGLVDVSIAVEHICLAATEKGLGTCWVCNFDAKMLLDLFDLPVDADPVALIPIGYPRVDNPEKKRKNLIEIVTEL